MDAVTPLIGPLVSFIVPHLSRLLQSSEASDSDDSQDQQWTLAKRIWSVLRPKVEAKPAIQEAAQDAAAQPEDADSVAALRAQLRKALTEDPTLRDEISRIFEEGKRMGTITVSASGERSVAVGGSLSGSTIVTGDQNRLRP